MVRTQIQLTEEQVRNLREQAVAQGRSMADLIRESVERYLLSPPRRDPAALRQLAVSVIGKYRSDVEDLARNHDRYLAEDFSR